MFRHFALLLTLTACLLPARAQVDSRLRTATDLLDVYKTTGGKPEVLTIFDFSTSMHAMYWHSQYYANVTANNHLTSALNRTGWTSTLPTDDGGNSGIVPVIDESGKVYMLDGDGRPGVNTLDNINYMDNSGTGRLVRPDGTLVPLVGPYNSQAKLTDLVLQASHVRMTATHNGVTRTIDLPIPWAILSRVGGTSPTVLTIPDTVGGGPAVTPDELYLNQTPNYVVNGSQTWRVNSTTTKTVYKIGCFRYNYDYLWWVFFGLDVRNSTGNGTTAVGTYPVPAVKTPTADIPWTNLLPGMARFQALKFAVVSVWLKNQAKVWWGFRYLDAAEQGGTTVSPDNGSASSTSITRDIRLFRPAQNSSTADPKLKQFVQALPNDGTPLTYAFANGYTQLSLNNDAQSTFGSSNNAGGQSGTDPKPIPACRNSFLVVFTDGIANDTYGRSSAIGEGSDVYAQGDAALGNTGLGSLSTALSPGTSNRFNIWTLSAVAAHYPAGSYVSPTRTSSISISTAAPFLISDRGATTSNKRRIRTMTVGMSLYGNLSDADGGKSAMYRAALYGNPKQPTWVNPTSATPTPPFDPDIPANADRNVNPFFFDAQSVDQLTAAMQSIIDEVLTASGSVSAPSAPLVGLSLGREAFLGLFEPAKSGPLWKGDLLAGGLKISNTTDTFQGNDGTDITSVNSENAIWSAGDLLQSQGLTYNFEATQYLDPTTLTGTGPRSWKPGYRKVITNLSGNTLEDLTETNANITKTTLSAASDAERLAIIRFLRGAHATAESGTVGTAPSIARITIMGDIISSSPAVLEYPMSLRASSPVLSSVDISTWKETHFRVIFVGDNQGYIHAFGEVGGVKYITDASGALVEKRPIAAVDELWAFYPGELLATLPKYLRNSANPHIYGLDGAPVVYFNDKPASGQVVGNRLVDGSDDVRMVIGMGKGGRNYYAFDVKDPYNPVLSWKLIPDTSTNTVVRRMGLSTSTPAIARVDVGGTATDVVFIGGGLSTKDVDTAMGSTLGRNLVAVNILTGNVEKAWDFSGIANMGSVTAPVVPVEYLPNTGKAQRVYFVDQPVEGATLGTGSRGSGLWVVGRTSLAANGVTRLDSSDLNDWSGGTFTLGGGLRRIYQASAGLIISTSPVPFRLATSYPITRTVSPLIRPSVLGLVFVTGDRNDPLDKDLINPSGQNQLNMLFDRQDSAALSGNTPAPANAATLDTNGFSDADLYDLTSVSTTTDGKIVPTSSSYYLKTKFGYKLLLGATTAKTTSDTGGANYYPKGPSSPAVLDSVLFFSLLKPGNVTVTNADGTTSQVDCTGTGQTDIWRMCNVMAPVFSSGSPSTTIDLSAFNTNASNCSGLAVSFANIPGPLTGLGTVGVLVSGQGKTSTGAAGSIATAGAEAEVVKGKTQNFAFRVRTWRIVR